VDSTPTSGKGSLIENAKSAVGINSNVDQTDIESYEPGLPVVAFRFSDDFQQKYPSVQQKWMQTLLRAKGWIVPNYELAPDLDKVQILRVVVRESMTEELVAKLVEDIVELTENITKAGSADHAMAILGAASDEQSQTGKQLGKDRAGKPDEGHASESSGTYAKQC
jgi:glutamate decarboxylase